MARCRMVRWPDALNQRPFRGRLPRSKVEMIEVVGDRLVQRRQKRVDEQVVMT